MVDDHYIMHRTISRIQFRIFNAFSIYVSNAFQSKYNSNTPIFLIFRPLFLKIVCLMVDDHYIMHRTISRIQFRTLYTFIIFLKNQKKTIYTPICPFQTIIIRNSVPDGCQSLYNAYDHIRNSIPNIFHYYHFLP